MEGNEKISRKQYPSTKYVEVLKCPVTMNQTRTPFEMAPKPSSSAEFFSAATSIVDEPTGQQFRDTTAINDDPEL